MSEPRRRPQGFQVLARFAPFYFAAHWRIVASYAAALIASALIVAAAWPLKFIIDAVLLEQDTAGPVGAALAAQPKHIAILALALAAAAIAVGAALSSALEKTINARLREAMTLRLRGFLLEDVLARPLSALAGYRSGEIVLRLIDDTGHVARLFCKTAPIVFRHLATTIITLGAMIYVNPAMGAIGFLIVLMLALCVRRAAPRLQAASRGKRRTEGAVAGLAQEILRHIRFVRAAGGETETREAFSARNAETLAAGVAETQAAVRLERRMQIANGLALAIVTGAGALFVARGALSIGGLTICLAYLNQLLKPVEKINELSSTVTGALVRAERLDEFLGGHRAALATPAPVSTARGAISFAGVSFAYDGGAPVLRNLSASIDAGETVWVRGSSGTGKSTFVDLLLRLYDPDAGVIALDGRPAADWPLGEWRAAFAVMLQNHHMFSGSVREAVAFGNPCVDDAAIWRALDSASMASVIRALPDGLDTQVSEAGDNFSGGERARLCLARAIAGERPVLVLDEPLANLDPNAQRAVLAAIRAMRGKRTIIIVSHQPVSAAVVDRTLTLDGGALFEAAAERAAS